MRIFCDTSVLVRANLKRHADYERASEVLRRVKRGEDKGFVAAHTLAETYGVLTGMPVHPRLSPSAAYALISENIVRFFGILMLTSADYVRVLQALSTKGVSGGVTYDALILEAARMAAPEVFYTFNKADFLRLVPDWVDIIREP